jgi:hypothetical protein
MSQPHLPSTKSAQSQQSLFDDNDDVSIHDESESRPGSRSPHSMGEGPHHGGGVIAAGDYAIGTVAVKRSGDEQWRILDDFVLAGPAPAPSGAAFSVGSNRISHDPACFCCDSSFTTTTKVGVPAAVGPVLDSGTAAPQPAGGSVLSGRHEARQRPVRAEEKESRKRMANPVLHLLRRVSHSPPFFVSIVPAPLCPTGYCVTYIRFSHPVVLSVP